MHMHIILVPHTKADLHLWIFPKNLHIAVTMTRILKNQLFLVNLQIKWQIQRSIADVSRITHADSDNFTKNHQIMPIFIDFDQKFVC